LSKLRVHDLAGEFGIPADEVVQLLRSMDVPVRNHLSPLSDDQVSRVRARWEREKRARVERQAAPVAPSRRRGAAKQAAPVEVAAPAPIASSSAAPAPGGVRRRRAADVPAAEPAAAAPAPVVAPPPTPAVAASAPPIAPERDTSDRDRR